MANKRITMAAMLNALEAGKVIASSNAHSAIYLLPVSNYLNLFYNARVFAKIADYGLHVLNIRRIYTCALEKYLYLYCYKDTAIRRYYNISPKIYCSGWSLRS